MLEINVVIFQKSALLWVGMRGLVYVQAAALHPHTTTFRRPTMPVKTEMSSLDPPPPANSGQPGVTRSLLYNGSRFQGHQKSKGQSYDVEVVLQVRSTNTGGGRRAGSLIHSVHTHSHTRSTGTTSYKKKITGK